MAVYLVTGAAGFIGSSITHALVARGDTVRAIDNLSTGLRSNLQPLLDHIDFREADLRDESAMDSACEGVDGIFHQAALPSVPRSIKEPRPSHASNLDGTFNLLEAARAAGVRRILYAASSSAYGNQPGLPRVESMTPQPIAPYPVQKLAGELYMQSYWRTYGIETISLRYFNIFGPRQRPDSPYSGVMAKFCLQMLRGETPTIFGDGEQGRDFTYIDNAVNANLLAMSAPAEKIAGRVFNIACGECHTLSETFSILAHLTGFHGQPNFAPDRAGDIRDSLADISAAREAFGYQPPIDFAEGLSRTVDWHRLQEQQSGRELDTIAEEWAKGGCRGCN
jgi:nucleoside-diphosphate-sugar epimerase